jgi:DNA-binding NtrC family response regulator
MNSTILAIVPDYNCRTRLYHLAVSLGVNIDFCETIGNAIGRLRFYNYAAVIVDFDSGGPDPQDSIEAMRRVALGIPIIAIINRSQERSLEEFIGKDIVASLTKPVDAKAFADAMQKLAVVSVV